MMGAVVISGQASHDSTFLKRFARDGSAFLIYFGLSILFFGRALTGHFSDRYIGQTPDATQFMWYLRWWPYALQHHLNPFWPRVIWPSAGVNLAWSASIPLPSVLAAPLTEFIGVIPAYNLLSLLAPALAGWAAYLFYRELTSGYWSAVVGGFVFGFSAHMIGKTFGNLNDALVVPIALEAWGVTRFIKGKQTAVRFCALSATLLTAQFLCFTELFATMTLIGGIAWGIGYVLAADHARDRLRKLLPPLGIAYLGSLVVLSPYLYYILAFPMRRTQIMPADTFSIDLLNFIIPTPLNQAGSFGFFAQIASHYSAGLLESGGYIAAPLLLIGWLFARADWRNPMRRWLIYMILAIAILALGPYFQIDGLQTRIALPWMALTKLPLIEKALPARLMVYLFLLIGALTAAWLHDQRERTGTVTLLTAAIGLTMMPNLYSGFWITEADVPNFFSTPLHAAYIGRDDNVLILPFGINGDSMLWQAAAGFDFRMMEGWTGFPLIPENVQRWPMLLALSEDAELPDAEVQLKGFLIANRIGTILVADRCGCDWDFVFSDSGPGSWRRLPISDSQRARWHRWFAGFDQHPQHVGGVTLYRFPLPQSNSVESVDEADLAKRDALARFDILFDAAMRYLLAGHDLHKLSPLVAARSDLLPEDWLGDHLTFRDPAGAPVVNRMLLTTWDDGSVAIGVVASPPAIDAVRQKYQAGAKAVYYTSADAPAGLSIRPPVSGATLIILMFDPQKLRNANSVLAPHRNGQLSRIPAQSYPNLSTVQQIIG